MREQEGGGKGKAKKRQRERERVREGEWSQRADTTCGCGGSDPVMEGDKFSGKPKLSGSLDESVPSVL